MHRVIWILSVLVSPALASDNPDALQGGHLKLSVSRSIPRSADRAPIHNTFGVLTDPGPLGLPLLINIGAKAWDLVVNNKRPLGVAFENTKAHALPDAVTAPVQISPWAGPTTHSFKLEYENLLGITMFSTQGRLQFYYGAPYEGRGSHIANLTVEPAEITARVGMTGNVRVRISEPVYKDGQVASMIVNTQLDLRGPIDNITETRSFEIQGDGEIVDLNR